jgi:hypothetical protein
MPREAGMRGADRQLRRKQNGRNDEQFVKGSNANRKARPLALYPKNYFGRLLR